MQRYTFTGHLSPTPAGMLPMQMSGDVYLAWDVEQWQRETENFGAAKLAICVTALTKITKHRLRGRKTQACLLAEAALQQLGKSGEPK